MDIKDIAERIKAWLEPKGFIQTRNKKLFIKDKGFYLIVALVHPHKALDGFCFDLAVKFLWSTSDVISYDYTVGDSSVYGQEDPTQTLGAILYNSENLDSEINYMMQEADKRINVYESLSDHQILLDRMQSRNDFISIVNRDFDKRDKAKAIAMVLRDQAADAREIFINNSPYDTVSELLAKSCVSFDAFVGDLLKVINASRIRLAAKLKVKLEPIEHISL